MALEEEEVGVVDQVVVEEGDHSRAMELQVDDDLDRPCREEGKDGGLLLRVDASLVSWNSSWVGNVPPSTTLFPLSFLLSQPFLFSLPTLPLLFFAKVSLTTFPHFLYFGGLLIETLLMED